jgi:2-polyprenyl-3-methyl-5-hydroxy-6-metoxy-1,4-benzoquinol methylase
MKLAERFSARQFPDARTRTAAARTFGYFTRHPVAPLNRRRLRLLLDAVEAESRKRDRALRILDLACGGGLVTAAVASLGHRTLGIELDPHEVKLAQEFNRESGLDAVFWQADLVKDPFWERTAEEILGGKPDIVLLAYALHHIPQAEYFVDRLGRWLPAGATLVINEENPASPLFRLKHEVRSWIQRDTEQEWHRTWSEWAKILERSGFQPSRPQGTDLIPAWARLGGPGRCWSLVFTATRR